ncbi:MAG: ABC transporter permease [Candidatus Bathyarchaeia archaeon]
MSLLSDIYAVFWADLRVLKRRASRTLATTLVNPVLYLLAFGYGLGRGISFEGYSYLDFVVPGIIALTAMTSSFNGAGSKLHVDRLFYKCFDELLMAPISALSIVFGKSLTGVVHGLISSFALVAVGLLVSPSFRASSFLPLFLVVLVVSCFVFSLLGVLAALLVRSHQDMGSFSAFVIVPMSFLSGTFFSLESVPEALKIALYFLPLTHSSLCLRAAALNQPFPWVSLIALIGFGIVFLISSIVVLRETSI